MKNISCATGTSQSRLKPIQNHLPAVLCYFVPRGAPVRCYHVSCAEKAYRWSGGGGAHCYLFNN